MNEATLAVREYEAAAELSEGLGSALRDLKRVQFGLPGASELTNIQVETSRQSVDNVLAAIDLALNGVADTHAGHVAISESLGGWIKTLRHGEGFSVGTVQRLRAGLAALPTAVSEPDFELLDQLLLVIDAHTTHLFHRIPMPGRTA